MELKRIRLLVAGFVLAGLQGFSQSTLMDYLETASSVVPNKMDVSLNVEGRYESNTHNRGRARGSSSCVLEGGLNLDVYRNINETKYGISGDIGYEYYTSDSDLSDFDWNLSPFVLGAIDLLGNDRLMLRISSRAYEEKYDSVDTTRVRRYDNNLGLTYDMVRHERWGVALTADYGNIYYSGSDYSDRSHQTFRFGLAPYYKLSEKTRTGIRTTYKMTKYRGDEFNDDSKSLTFTAFADYRMSEKISAHVDGGFQRTRYEGNAEGTEGDDEFSPVASASVSYSPVSNITFTARSAYEWEDSTSASGGRSSWDNSLGMSWKMTQKLTLSQSVGVEDINEKNNDADSKEYSYDLRASYQLLPRMSVYSGYEYSRTTFKNGDYREYDCHEIYLGASYAF